MNALFDQVSTDQQFSTDLAGDEDWRLFAPKLDDNGTTYATIRKLVLLSSGDAISKLEDFARSLSNDGLFILRARAAALVLRDLLGMGWEVRADREWIFVRPSTGPEGSNKEAIRRQLEFGREDQLRESSNRKFLYALERPSRFSALEPVTNLIADGRRIASQIRDLQGQGAGIAVEALKGICDPYLQLVDADTRDEFTGIRLMDIWRYFRHNWATRYRSTPGRNIFYLIRDRAQPNHPVMGITALGNAVMQLTPRDTALGWTIEGLEECLSRGEVSDSEVLASFRRRLSSDLTEIYLKDLPVGEIKLDEITDELLGRLLIIESQAVGDRLDRLRDADEQVAATRRVEVFDDTNLEALALTPLFRAKRARAVRELLRAIREVEQARSISDLLKTADGQWAIGQAIRQLKKQFSATGLMEITVCGAVPPYNHLLGGKLACLLMMSPRIVEDYASRYENTYSIIASQMAGRLIVKRPELVFLGTSSLYNRSSQYNRVKLPAGTVPGQTREISYALVGETLGFGSPNLSSETESLLEKLSRETREYRNVNFMFGEGQSPKLRQMREGFAALGLNRTNVLNHGSRRTVYGVHLAENTVRYLLGVDEKPIYSLPANATSTDAIAEFWRKRWLANRLGYAPALDAVSRSTPLSERVSRLIPETRNSPQLSFFSVEGAEDRHMALVAAEDEKLAFIRQLYRDESAYSDHVKLGRLRELNVRTKLDEVVRKIVRSGGSVVITGNAGDGKTHTIRLLESDLKAANARVIIDASAVTQEEVIADWVQAREASQPFCIAINEGPLIDLIRTHCAAHPWLEEVRQQLLGLVSYVQVDEEDETRYQPEPGSTVVIDLSLRRTLAPDLIKRVVEKLTDDVWYSSCASCSGEGSCPVSYNRTMLRNPQVQERLVALLNRVAERGVRATFREVLAFVSYLIFGGRPCAELNQEPQSDQNRYYWNAFEGQGSIFEALETGLDPFRQTAPRVDEDLWRGRYQAEDFVGHSIHPTTPRNLDAVREHQEQAALDGFVALKRRWYFEHPLGTLTHMDYADRLLHELQDNGLSTQLRVGRIIALINEWWNPADRDQQDRLRLWTRLSYSPRANGKAMVSGRDVSNLRLNLFKPRLAPALRAAFGEQATDHIVLAPPDNIRFANLVIDRKLLACLLFKGATEHADEVERRLTRFNDALAQHAEVGSHVRTIEVLDPDSELNVRVRVDLSQRRYDSAQ
jgi:hypothetical protein